MRWVLVCAVVSMSCGIKGPPLPPLDAPNAPDSVTPSPLFAPPDAGPCCQDKVVK
jgi:hypothetical protein